ncbi:hypothetical protein Phi19:2_gp012 [Cellulophaga phage phi19:2]|uniref:Uncharacterized protein n=2 Tax=Cellulophaga phage phiST TaxID=756282 RepID=M4SKC2_9CAUD|nr:hypothetical protein CGPG_00094 [Cellulophaga phage phiST]AGH56792.1 hypothetical protein CGPG_00094 [Cellulophaga phage phiST]AGO47151.1 hypothetical protein PhiST_gp012 [Cellulophaga phage phiST]AGO48647.1 hypothetical protein Phi19:2_gp012 [Cellulophaga phage phi19:2]
MKDPLSVTSNLRQVLKNNNIDIKYNVYSDILKNNKVSVKFVGLVLSNNQAQKIIQQMVDRGFAFHRSYLVKSNKSYRSDSFRFIFSKKQ